eukprot:Skav220534  [mRNA]  locus=scaffold1629:143687:150245:+ [translate_table: standard]
MNCFGYVRINDLAAPPEPVHPLMYVEPFVALLIVANGVLTGTAPSTFCGIWREGRNDCGMHSLSAAAEAMEAMAEKVGALAHILSLSDAQQVLC